MTTHRRRALLEIAAALFVLVPLFGFLAAMDYRLIPQIDVPDAFLVAFGSAAFLGLIRGARRLFTAQVAPHTEISAPDRPWGAP